MKRRRRKKRPPKTPEQIRSEWKSQQYDRFHKTYTLEEVLPHIVESGRKAIAKFDGNLVKMYSLRLRTFKIHGTKCVTCGTEGTFFALERNHGPPNQPEANPTGRYHFNLYGYNENGTEVILTKDHIRPKSKDGQDTINNMQTMCGICNCIKGNSTK